MNDQNNELDTALAAGQLIGAARQPLRNEDGMTPDPSEAGIPYVLVPQNSTVKSLEHLLPRPSRKQGLVSVARPESFVEFLSWHSEVGRSTIYVCIDSEASLLRAVCVLNDHSPDAQNWRDHRCIFEPRLSVEWKRWIGQDRKQMTQGDFAAWLEENRGDVATLEGMPDGAQILEMALKFEATAEKRLKSHVSLSSGCRSFEFVDREDDGTRTLMKVFERFTIGIPVFAGSTDAYPIEARLRYRNNSGTLGFWYELIRADKVFKQAAEEIAEGLAEKSGITLIHGDPGK